MHLCVQTPSMQSETMCLDLHTFGCFTHNCSFFEVCTFGTSDRLQFESYLCIMFAVAHYTDWPECDRSSFGGCTKFSFHLLTSSFLLGSHVVCSFESSRCNYRSAVFLRDRFHGIGIFLIPTDSVFPRL